MATLGCANGDAPAKPSPSEGQDGTPLQDLPREELWDRSLTDLAAESDPCEPAGPLQSFPEGGYGWVSVALFSAYFWGVGMINSFGIFTEFFTTNATFPGANTSLALVTTVMSTCVDLFAPLTGALDGSVVCGIGQGVAPLWGSVVSGLGYSCSVVPAVGIPSQWFKEKLGLTTALGLSGMGGGGIVISPVAQLWSASAGTLHGVLLGFSADAGGEVTSLNGATYLLLLNVFFLVGQLFAGVAMKHVGQYKMLWIVNVLSHTPPLLAITLCVIGLATGPQLVLTQTIMVDVYGTKYVMACVDDTTHPR
ncbi:hypothetical protein M427DRAFT_31091 [Gonapodya prolifera JEL478]|uniref:MFS general substrate transporter n=1 Tax=Gonapodya prolifera (strain JEL478) TaxID=1344416 RepID=A0A139AJN5_GONPJ|nr:hypothetical protein M427DRAFT_31091 [Gonapodya prolifera JEL478]|eukprot:KXS16693.1 hypothetical protein M427DRAFT_31091 [Gonapodya prolifera JEL478]